MSTKYIASNWRLPNEENSNKSDNYGLSFDGSSEYINCGNVEQLKNASVITWNCWVNFATANYNIVFGKHLTTTTDAIQFYTWGSGIGYFWIKTAGTSVTATINPFIGSLVNLNEWNMFSIVFDGTQTGNDRLKIYLNGGSTNIITSYSATPPATLPNTTDDFFIGNGANGDFVGSISQFSIFDYSLSSTQISTLYGSSSLGAGNPMAIKRQPVGYWPLGDNSASNPLTQPNEAVEDASVFEFDGSNYIAIPTDTSLNSISDTVSISQWIKFTGTSQQYITNFGNDYGTFVNNGKFAVVFRDTGNTQRLLSSTLNINDGEWHHVLAVKTTTNLYIYIDGGAAESNSNGDTGRTSTRSNAIGALFDGSIKFTGNISNVAVWDSDQSSEKDNIYNSGVPATSYTNTPTAWYKLDQSANWEADSSGAWQIPDSVSAYPQSFDFVPNDYIEVSDSDSLSFGDGSTDSPFSISAWVNFDDVTNSMILSKHTTGQFEYSFLVMSNDKLIFQLNSQLGSNLISRYYNTTITSYEGQWIHLVGTYDGSRAASGIKIYLNGTRVDDNDFTSGTYEAMSNGTAPVQIGRRLTNYMNGKISNAQIYNIELSSSQVETLYNNGTPLTTAIASDNLKLWAKLDNSATWTGSAFSVPDASGNGNTGTSSGMTEQNLVNNNVSALNGESSGMTSASLVLSDLSRNVPYDSYSFNFDGSNDYIQTGGLTINNTFTFSCWLNVDSFSLANQCFLSSPNYFTSGQDGNFIIRLNNNTTINFFSYDGSANVESITCTVPTISTGSWHHFALTNDGTTAQYYWDGSPITTTGVNTKGLDNLSAGLIIGDNITNNNNAFNGEISNVSIFNEALTSTEVLKLYANGVPQDLTNFTPQPVAWYPLGSNSFWNGSQWTVRDMIGSNDGTGQNIGVDGLVGDAPRSEANGTGTNMDIPTNLEGSTKWSDNNSWSINMSSTARVEDTP